MTTNFLLFRYDSAQYLEEEFYTAANGGDYYDEEYTYDNYVYQAPNSTKPTPNNSTLPHSRNDEYFGYEYLEYGNQSNTTTTNTTTVNRPNNKVAKAKQFKPEKEKK